MIDRPTESRFRHILEAIREIEGFTREGEIAFHASLMAQRAVLYDLLVIGEAARTLTTEARETCPEVPWNRVVGLRDILSHEYFKVDIEVFWGIVLRHLPVLKTQIESVLDSRP